MPLLKSGDDGNMVADRAHFDLTLEIADSERQKPWPSDIYAKTLYKKSGFPSSSDLDGSRRSHERTSYGWHEFGADAQVGISATAQRGKHTTLRP